MIMNNSVIFFISSVNIAAYSKNGIKCMPAPSLFIVQKKGLVGVKYDYVGRVHKKGLIVF